MNLLVDSAGNLAEDLSFRHFCEFVKPVINRGHHFVVDATFLSHNAGLHIVEVVLLALLEARIVPLLLELLCLEIVARIVLITDTKGHEVELLESLYDCTFSGHRKHLEQRLLRLVATVFSSTLSLRNPDIFVFLLNGVMHVTTHSLTTFEEFPRTESPLNREGFIEFDERLNPRIYEEIIANRYLAGRREFVLMKHQVKDCAIEHDISMIAYESVTFWSGLYPTISEGTTRTAFVKDILHDRLHETQLELERRIDSHES